MIVTKTIEAHVCDFCEKERLDVCVVCAKDICLVHSAILIIHQEPFHSERICYDHYTDDVKEFLKQNQH